MSEFSEQQRLRLERIQGSTVVGDIQPFSGTSATPDLRAGNTLDIAVGGAFTLNNPTNKSASVDGTVVTAILRTTNGNTISYGSDYVGSSDLALPGTLTVGATKVDILVFKYDATLDKMLLLSKVFGFN